MAAGHAILASVIAVGLVVGANAVGVLDKTSGGDASSFDFGTATPDTGVEASDTTAPADTSPVAVEPDGATTVFATVVDATTTIPPSTIADAGRTPTSADPARVYIAGDSDAGNLGPPLEGILADTDVVTSDLVYKVSSGLSRPDFFDWPAQLQRDVTSLDPDIVVVTFGGNDAQDIEIDGRSYPVASEEWKAEYSRRVGAVMDFLSADGRTLVWVGIPNAKSGDFRDRLDILQTVTKAEAAERPAVRYVDTWNRFVGASGGYADYIIDPRDRKGKLVRADDGFHLNQTGAEILAIDVAREVVLDLIARGAALSAPS